LTILGIKDNILAKIIVSPNPTKDVLNVEVAGSIASLKIYNSLGQLILYKISLNRIDISSLEQGFYFLYIADMNGKHSMVKVAKE
jgi:hypothetical protein